MFEAQIKDNKGFAAILGNLTLVDEYFQLEYGEHGMRFSILDKAHVLFISGEIKPSAFSFCKGDNGVAILATDDFQKATDIVRDHIYVRFENNQLLLKGTNNGMETEYKLPEYDEDIKSAPLPEFSADETGEITVDFLKTAIKNSERMGSSVYFHTTETTIEASAENFWQFSSKLKAPGSFTQEHSVQVDSERLKIFTKFAKISKKIRIGLATDKPLKIDIANDDIAINGLIAPRLGE